MKTYKLHVQVISGPHKKLELQFEVSAESGFSAYDKACEYLFSLNIATKFIVLWQEEVADDEADWCACNPLNEDGFINWEHPEMSTNEIIELKMQSIEENIYG